jgi:hypothetical protein
LFFDSGDALVGRDDNGRQDVYEWEEPGSGVGDSCSRSSAGFSESAGGCVFAISNVAGDYESFFLDASPSGDDVFFATEDQLVPEDTDAHVDIYDARVGGGFPVTVQPPACDNGDSCKGPVSGQPEVFVAPASATFSGVGNLAPVPSVTPSKPAVESRAEKLAKALKVCRVKKNKHKRLVCEALARKRYGPVKKAKKSDSVSGRASSERGVL